MPESMDGWTLHYGLLTNEWHVADTMFVLVRHDLDRCWFINPDIHAHHEAGDWLDRTGLRSQRFATRRDALRTLVAHLQTSPPDGPWRYQLPPVRQVRAGHYDINDARITIYYEDRRWWAINDNGHPLACAVTLHALRVRLEGMLELDRRRSASA